VYFAFDAEQEQLRDAIKQFCLTRAPESEVRRLADGPQSYDSAVWAQACEQLGLAALAIPERFGGAGFGAVELGIAVEEAGAALLCLPLLATNLAAQALLLLADDPAREQYLPAVAAGTTIATVALRGSGVGGLDAGAELPVLDGGRVTGSCPWVPDADSAGLVVMLVRDGERIVPAVVELPADGVSLERVESVDPTRRHFHLGLQQAAAAVVGPESESPRQQLLDVARVLIATEQLGVAQRALDMACDYGKVREQFGRPIGSFQAIKHTLASVLLEVESARSAVWFGLWAAQHDPAQLPLASRIAGATSGDCALQATSECIQVHGGIGMTWEHPAQLYYKRALVNRQFLGDPQQQRAEIAARIL